MNQIGMNFQNIKKLLFYKNKFIKSLINLMEQPINKMLQQKSSYIVSQNHKIIKLKDSFKKLKNKVSKGIQNGQKFPFLVQMQKLTLEDIYDWYQLALELNKNLSMVFSHCHFLNLKYLRINDPGVDYIECLTYLDAPLLKYLQILQINVVNVKSLNKTNFKLLSTIRLTDNPITELNLSRTKFQASRCYLYLQQQDSPQNTLMQDLSQLVKLQTSNLDQLIIEARKRIFHPKLENKVLKQRFTRKKKNGTLESVTIFNQFYDWGLGNIEQQLLIY